jgi:hypothetical protein
MNKVQRSGGHWVSRAHWRGLLAVGFLFLAARTFAADQPIITVGPDALAPQRIEVHVGELIRWRAPDGEHLHLRLDTHPHAHEAVVRSGEIRAIFLLPGVHTYEVLLITDGRKALAGTVVVKEAEAAVDPPRTCGPDSFKEVCFEP